MSITPSGSVSNSASSTTATVRSPRSSTTGRTRCRYAGRARPAHGSALPARCRPARCHHRSGVAGRTPASGCASRPRAQRDQLHGGPGRADGAAVQTQWQFRCGRGLSDRRPPRPRARRSGRLLRQHPGAAGRPGGGSRASQSCWRRCGHAASPPSSTRMCRSKILVERLNPTRSLTHHPLVQVMLGWQNLPLQHSAPAGGLVLGDLQVTPMPVDIQTARMDFAFSLAERWTADGDADGIGGVVEFRTDVFEAASVEVSGVAVPAGARGLTADPPDWCRQSSCSTIPSGSGWRRWRIERRRCGRPARCCRCPVC